jgi:1A family penicillin-binding protein
VGAGALAAAALLIGSQIALAGKAITYQAPGVDDLRPLDQRSLVLDRNNRVIAVLHAEQNRSPVPLKRVPKVLINAILATEDALFYQHHGVNVRSTVRAVGANVDAGGVAQGGSTITQQLVKLSLLSSKQELQRKVKEAVLALELEKKLTKDQILERYLNEVYFGQGAYGVQAASERYFQHPVDSLTVGESAFLAGMIRNPVGYDPTRFRERSRARRAVVLDRMVVVGQITRDDAAQLKRSAMPRPADRLAKPDTYFIEAVKQELLNDIRLGRTAKDRYEAVFNGGLRILTTFDPTAQDAAERAVANVVPADEPDFTAAVASVDVASGAVRAMVGGRGFETDKYNLVTQGLRQPGSSWKPIVFLSALEQGISPLSYLSGKEPCPIPNPGGLPDPFEPKNAGDATGKIAGLSDQLVASSNCAFARLAYIVGYRNIIDTARRLGITTRIDAVPAMALGVEEVHPLEMAGVYATIAAGGIKRTPFLIREVRGRDGKSLFRTKVSQERVADANLTSVVIDAMTQVVERGTGTAAQLPGRAVAGKTGTTNNYEDAWFVGFTPQLATAVWMGSPRAKISMSDVGGIKVFGGTYPARIWHEYSAAVLATEPILAFAGADYSVFSKADCLTIVDEPKSTASRSSSVKTGKTSAKKKAKKRAKSTKVVAVDVPVSVAPDPVPVADPSPAPAAVGGRGFSVQVPSVGPALPVVNFTVVGTAGPQLPRATLTQGTRCQDRFRSGSSAKKKAKATSKAASATDSSPAPVQVANTAAPVAPEPAPAPEPVVVTTPPPDLPQ